MHTTLRKIDAILEGTHRPETVEEESRRESAAVRDDVAGTVGTTRRDRRRFQPGHRAVDVEAFNTTTHWNHSNNIKQQRFNTNRSVEPVVVPDLAGVEPEVVRGV
jgi:hypothetical protein